MKKTLATLLCLVMLLALVACSKAPNEPSNEPNNETNTQGNSTANTGNAAAVPTEEEKTQIEKYQTAVRALNAYVKEGVLVNYKLGEEYLDKTESLGYYYKDILAAECVEKWVGTEYASDDTINWNRQEVLDNFVVVEDVLLGIKEQFEDKLGNIEPNEIHYTYGADGNLREVSLTRGAVFPFFGWSIEHTESSGTSISYIYEDNRLVKIQCSKNGDIVKTITPTYNENGLKIKDLITDAKKQREYAYTYDSNDRLITVTEDDMTIKLSYDEKGYLTEYLRTYGSISDLRIQYTYNDDHSMCTGEWYSSNNTLTGTYTYTFDETSRILTGEFLDYYSDRAKTNYELIYGNYYIYKPAMEDKD